MAQIPTPLRAALGLVANAIEGARTLPDKAVELPVLAVSTALQFSLRAQQRYAEFALRGDELIGRIRGVPEEPPSWATFDDEPGDEVADESADIDADRPDPVPAPIPIERREPNATPRRSSTTTGTESPVSPAVKSAAKQPRARKAATAKKDRAGKTTAKRADAASTKAARAEGQAAPSAFDKAVDHDAAAQPAAPEPSEG